LAGLPTGIPFLLLFIVLIASPKGRFVEVTRARVSRRRRVVALGRFPWKQVAVLFTAAALLPFGLHGTQLLHATNTLAFVLVFSSLSLLVGLSRQLSLCHVTFVVFGATSLGHFMDAGLPYPLALLLAGLVIVPLGAIVAIPAIRLSGLFLALATFGFGILAQALIFSSSLAFGKEAIVKINRPGIMESDRSLYLVVLAIVAVAVVLIEIIRVTRLGRVLRALADSGTAVESIGILPSVPRVLIFCASAFMAAIAGGLIATITQAVTPYQFESFNSLIWITVLVGAGAATLGGSVLAALLLVTAPAVITSRLIVEYQPIFFGLAAMLLAQAPNGLVGLLRLPDVRRVLQSGQWRYRTGPVWDRARLAGAVEEVA
jgi:ABC-type branched-subunit amino acid transport system permease subunit